MGLKHKLARKELEKYAQEKNKFTLDEIINHLNRKTKSYQLTTNELANILGKSNKYERLNPKERMSIWKYRD